MTKTDRMRVILSILEPKQVEEVLTALTDLLHYSYSEIEYKHEGLTNTEKQLVDEPTFVMLAKLVREMRK